MAKAEARDYVSMECEACGSRNYRTSKKIKGATYKLKLPVPFILSDVKSGTGAGSFTG